MNTNRFHLATGSALDHELQACHLKLVASQHASPDWTALFDDEFQTGEASTMVQLLREAPNEFSLGVLYGALIARQVLAQFTGRDLFSEVN